MATQATDDSIEWLLSDLQSEYLAGFATRLAELRAALDRSARDPAAREGLQRFAHRIGGTAGTVGLSDLGDAGRAIELACTRCGWSPEELARLAAAIDDLAAIAARAASWPAGVPREPVAVASLPSFRALLEGAGA